MTVLSIDRLKYVRNEHCTVSLDRMELKAGKVLGVLGPNGAGKSTLLKLICGDLQGEGDLQLHGRSIESWDRLDRARHMGVLPQSSHLDFHFRVREVIELGLTPLRLSKADSDAGIERVMGLCHCGDLADRPYPSLSGGEKQRVQLARVLLQLSQAELSPLYLLDEPTSSQDIGQQHMVLSLLQQVCRESGSCAMVILHDLNHASNYCDQILLMHQGLVVAQGKPDDVIDLSAIESLYQYRPVFASKSGKGSFYY